MFASPAATSFPSLSPLQTLSSLAVRHTGPGSDRSYQSCSERTPERRRDAFGFNSAGADVVRIGAFSTSGFAFAASLVWHRRRRRGGCRAELGIRRHALPNGGARNSRLAIPRLSRAWCQAQFRRLVARRAVPKSDPESLRWALELAVRAEEYEEAAMLRDMIKQADAENPAAALLSLARERIRRAVDVALSDGRRRSEILDAIEELRSLATLPASFPEAEDGLHRVLRESPSDDAVEMAESALWAAWLPSGDEDVDQIMRQGLKFMGASEMDKAIDAFSEAVQMAPDFPEGWNKLATSLFLAERLDDCIEHCYKVLELKPRHFGCLSGLGICYLRKGDEEAASRWLRKALEINPKSNDMRRIVSDLEARSALAHLKPRIKESLAELRGFSGHGVGCFSRAAATAQFQDCCVKAEWDVYLVQDLEEHTYFFRVRVQSFGEQRVGAVARYYALRPKGGTPFPLSRVTQGAQSFELGPSETYGYSFMLTLGQELEVAQGGLLLRCDGEFFEVELARLCCADAILVQEEELEQINNGFNFIGRLNIQMEE